MKRIVTAIVFLIFAMISHSQSLHFTNIMVGGNGDIHLRWSYSGVENMFDSCVVEKYQTVEYSPIAVFTDYDTKSWTDTAVENNDDVQKYRITLYTKNGAMFVDSVKSMYLDVSDISSEYLMAFLIWDTPSIANSDSGYYVILPKSLCIATLLGALSATTQ